MARSRDDPRGTGDRTMTTEREVHTTQRLIEPLNEHTKQLFRPLRLRSDDRLRVQLTDDKKHFLVKAYAEDAEGNALPASFQAEFTFFNRLPEKRRPGEMGPYKVPATDTNVTVINALWPREQVVFDAEAKLLFNFLLLRFTGQASKLQQVAAFKEHGVVPDVKGLLDESLENPLNPYQRMAALMSMGEEGYALFMEQGTGKTPVVIARINSEAARKDGHYRALVVCPKNVRSNWKSELSKFSTCDGRVAVIRGGKLKRIKTLIEVASHDESAEWTVVVVSYESLVKTWDAFRLMQWDLVVLDESHNIKSPSTQRWRHIRLLRDRSKSRMILTGTAIANKLSDLWTQLEFLYEGGSGFTSLEAFKRFYNRYVMRGRFKTIIGYDNLPIIKERLARLAFTITKAEALPHLPKKMYDVREVKMTQRQTELYKELAEQLIVECDKEMERSENKVMTASNILVKLLRLAQITSGFATWDPEYDAYGNQIGQREIDRFDPNPKLEELVQFMKERGPKSKSVVWACWKQDIRSIRARLEMEGYGCVTYYGSTKESDREEAIRRFNTDPSCTVFISNPGAGGTGVNLHGYDLSRPDEDDHNCDHVVYYSQDWSSIKRGQSEDRCHRIGTRVPVKYTDLCVPGTIDEEIRARVLTKRMSAYEIQDVREILNRVLRQFDVED